MSAHLEQLAPKWDDGMVADNRTTRPRRRSNTGSKHRNATAALVLVPVLCLASVVASCGTTENTTRAAVNGASDDGDLGKASQHQLDVILPTEEPVQVPDVVGLSSDEAHARLEDAGFYVKFDAYDTPETEVRHDTVTSMEPIAGTLAPYGSTVVLDIFAEPVRVPDVVGLSGDEAHTQLENARFKVGFYAYDTPEPGVQHDTVTSTDPIAGTLVPFGSTVMLRIYLDNPPDTPAMTEEDWDRVRIGQKVVAEFGDRIGPTHWDETTATLNFQISDLSADDISRLQSRYANEVYAVTFSAATVSLGELQALNRSTGDLVRAVFAECGTNLSSYGNGIKVESWSVSVSWSVNDLEHQPNDECINEMKEAVLANAANFVKEHSIPAEPTDLVRFRAAPTQGPDILHD